LNNVQAIKGRRRTAEGSLKFPQRSKAAESFIFCGSPSLIQALGNGGHHR